MIRTTIAATLVVTVLWTTTWTTAPIFAQEAPLSPIPYEVETERLDRVIELIEGLRSQIDRSQFDLEALLERLDYDSDKIIEFVKEEIYFEQYPGLLRGAKGTLMSRSGNALDQAVLLATLLKDAGFEARIAEGQLDPGGVQELLQSSFQARKPPAGPFDPDSSSSIPSWLEKSLDAISEENRFAETHPDIQDLPQQSDIQELRASSESTSEAIQKALNLEQIKLGGDAPVAELRSQAALYHWVDYKDSATGRWISAHPARQTNRGRPGPAPVTSTRAFTDEVPADLLHRIGLEVFLEQRLGANAKTRTVMPLWERPTANLAGEIIKYMNVPGSLARGEAGLPKRDTELFFPVFNGALIGSAFDMTGNLIPADEAASSYAALFQTLGSKLNKAGGLLSSLGSTGDQSPTRDRLAELTAVTLRITLTKPSGEMRVVQRSLFDSTAEDLSETEPPSDSFLSDFADLTQNVSLAVFVGSTPSALFWDRSLESLQGHLRLVNQSIIPGSRSETEANIQETVASFEPAEVALYGLDLNMGANNGESRLDSVDYRSEPGVVSHRWRSQEDGVASSTIDILANARTGLQKQGQQVKWDPGRLVDIGVLETHLERIAVPKEFGKKSGTTDLLSFAELERSQYSILQTAAEVEDLSLNPDVAAEIRADLVEGYVVLTARQATSQNPMRLAWWRVHPSTGETLGMIGPRLGGAVITERVVKNLLIGAMTWALIAAVEFDACYSVPAEGAEIEEGDLFQICVACATITSTLWMISLVSIIWALYTGGASEGAAGPGRAVLIAQLVALAAQAGCSLASGASD